MATLQEVQTKLDGLQAAVETEHEQAATTLQEVVDLKAEVVALKDQIAAGTATTPADLDGLITRIDTIQSGVTNIIPDVPVPPPTV